MQLEHVAVCDTAWTTWSMAERALALRHQLTRPELSLAISLAAGLTSAEHATAGGTDPAQARRAGDAVLRRLGCRDSEALRALLEQALRRKGSPPSANRAR